MEDSDDELDFLKGDHFENNEIIKKFCPRNYIDEISVFDCSIFEKYNEENYIYDEIEELDISRLNIQKLGKLPENLRELNCSENQIEIIDNLPKSLRVLNCSQNCLRTFPILNEEIEEVDCSGNQIIKIPTLPSSLEKLDISHNGLIFDSLNNFNVKHLRIDGNILKNGVKEIIISEKIEHLHMNDVNKGCKYFPPIRYHKNIDYLYIRGNGIRDLGGLKNLSSAVLVDASENSIKNLNLDTEEYEYYRNTVLKLIDCPIKPFKCDKLMIIFRSEDDNYI
jgi:Leucine-rich repeat (LRR) protein